MKEVEILVEVFSEKKEVLDCLNQYSFIGENETLDIYFFDPLKTNLKPVPPNFPREWFRLRRKADKNYLAYKVDNFDKNGLWLYSDEYETEIGNFETTLKIIQHLGLRELITINNLKHAYKTSEYEIVFEEVKNLGQFLEVEKLDILENEDIDDVKEKIQNFINDLNLEVSSELNIGKPEMMLKKLH